MTIRAQNGLIFAVHIWNPDGPEPDSIWEVLTARRTSSIPAARPATSRRQKPIHRLRHVIRELADDCPRTRASSRGPDARTPTAA